MIHSYPRSVVIGKFYPPHAGHHHLIDTALRNSDHVDVLVVDNPGEKISAKHRRDWLAAAHPNANVRVIPDIGKDDDSIAWAAHTTKFLRYVPDAVFTSETYGDTWAYHMGATHISVDHNRNRYPISGTKIRADVFGNWQCLSDPVRAGLAARIVVVGAESTGTTTLTRAVAEELGVEWVPEVGRYYTESILTTDYTWTDDDFHRIGALQQQYENTMAARSNGVIICDTNAWATLQWQRRYLGHVTDTMRNIAERDRADLYIITGDEIPFVQDGIRDGEHIRHEMHRWFVDAAAAEDVPSVVVNGSVAERMEYAMPLIKAAITAAGRIV